MAISNSSPMKFSPKGLTDAFDATEKFPGACQSLKDLIFDQSNPEIVVPRPGVSILEQLAVLGLGNPTFISVFAAVGTRIYGMCTTTLNPGKDQPFCVDVAAGALVPITGITNANSPTAQNPTGDWNPPIMASIGAFIIVTHPGFDGTGTNFFGVINLTNPALPVWSSANLATQPLTAVPTGVANLNNRAYFIVSNKLPFSDVLAPTTRTNATQELVVGDTATLTALSGLPIQTTSSGVLSALIAWKATQVWQVTGDPVTNDHALNFISLTVGTNSPRTIAQSIQGIYFISTGGPYIIDPLGSLRPLTNRFDSHDPDLTTPFINAVTPSRWAGAYNSSIYRVCGQTILRGVPVTVDYWFDERRRRWHGPHSFAYDCASAIGGYFVLSSYLKNGWLMQSYPSPQTTSVYDDLGSAYSVDLLSSTFPKVGDMFQKQVAESQIELGGAPLGASYTITAQDSQGSVLDSVAITIPRSPGFTVWGGGGVWGDGGLWNSGQNIAPQTYLVPWTAPLVFEKMQLEITALASANVQIGAFYARYQKTGYMTQVIGA